MEHEIYRYLAECKSLYDTHAAIGVLPPSAIVGSPYSFAFVAMPMHVSFLIVPFSVNTDYPEGGEPIFPSRSWTLFAKSCHLFVAHCRSVSSFDNFQKLFANP